ncbi:uncharacterized protein G2W53_040151 [Senna tora]|uniref:Uncharacterized protein n=1 Tax=Senna tora TaxID=362788 RepID=A0A834SS88_9FABA|nr:uncharacterized protein G2W53_040151 [Senna tora]
MSEFAATSQGCVGGGRSSSFTKNQSRKSRGDGLKRNVSSWISKGSFDKKPIALGKPDCSSFAKPSFHRSIEGHGCVGGKRLSSSKEKQSHKRRRDGLKRKVSSRISLGLLNKKPITQGVTNCSTFTNPAFHGSIEEECFDSNAECFGGGEFSYSKKKQSRKRRKGGLKRRVSLWITKGSLDKNSITPGIHYFSSFANPVPIEVLRKHALTQLLGEGVIMVYAMGVCASTPQGCVGGGRFSSFRKKQSRKRRRDGL